MTSFGRRRRRAAALQICCVGLLSMQATVCHAGIGKNLGRAFLGWRGLFGRKKNQEDPLLLSRQHHYQLTRPQAFLLGWRGGSSDGYDQYRSNNNYPPPNNNDNHRYHAQQQQNPPPQYNQQHGQTQQQQRPPPDLPADLPGYGDTVSVNDRPAYGQQQSTSSSSYPPSPGNDNPYQHHSAQQQNPYPPDPSLPPPQQDLNPYGQPPPGSNDPPMPSFASYHNDDPMMITEDEQVPWDEDPTTELNSNEPDLSSFNKEYIMKGLARLYKKKILPIELSSRYGHFHSPPLSPADFDSPPAVLLLGPFSVGKTSFIKYLLGRDFPGIRVGPEPTTDRFTAVLYGADDKIVPGAALCAQNFRPFTGLSPFGNNFLSRMEGVELDSDILRNVTLIDTPGILSGQKQRDRNYDYESVMKWFAERADLIIIMFDAHKLDISDEMKQVMELMIPHLDKVRIVLNKADNISPQQLMRVYGALMWSLGKVMNTPEVCRVYMGSFWDKPLKETGQQDLLQREEMDLLDDIMKLPQQAVMRRINELVKRARSVKVHAYIIHYLRKQLPYNPWQRRGKQERLIRRLEQEFKGASRRYGLPMGDFPPADALRKALYEIKDIGEFPKLDKKMVREMEKVFSHDIPLLLDKARDPQ
ncbi:EH domain-containing protein [Seminavis robusta]|uniref:EH domain-containing protein n=1 Tax=Seminavis robusta TaxID=568900 RepID=A0A9N8HD64_9STRA|nr:EH domain-containing protein [Seminavis robusta]|eukprot:Sro411_g137660.1 EH domain-containing protein (641) ;mRNA; r:33876-36031